MMNRKVHKEFEGKRNLEEKIKYLNSVKLKVWTLAFFMAN